jgi:Fic family protein
MTYIHQRRDWPDFIYDLELLTPLLSKIHRKQGELVGKMNWLGFQVQDQSLLQSLSLDVLKSSEIEGEYFDSNEVRSSIARRLKMDAPGMIPSDRYVDGVVEMLLDATQNCTSELTTDRLFYWHTALFPDFRASDFPFKVGNWRTDENGIMQVVSGALGRNVVHFEAPKADLIPDEMDAFLFWFNQEDNMDLVLKAALAHLWFLTIHPFDDGNGRIARAISDLLLTRSEGIHQRYYSMSSQIRIERNAYYKKLEATQRFDMDVTSWMHWFLNCLHSSLLHAEAALESVLFKSTFWNMHRHTAMNDRQVKMVNALLDGFEGNCTAKKWSKIGKCSPDSALRDITDLIKKEVLIKESKGGRSTSYALIKSATIRT